MENRQDEDGSWSVPEALEQFGAPGKIAAKS
jgi:seryl-tRNA synthetase